MKIINETQTSFRLYTVKQAVLERAGTLFEAIDDKPQMSGILKGDLFLVINDLLVGTTPKLLCMRSCNIYDIEWIPNAFLCKIDNPVLTVSGVK